MALRVGATELDPGRRQPVDDGCLDVRMPVASQVVGSECVNGDEDDIPVIGEARLSTTCVSSDDEQRTDTSKKRPAAPSPSARVSNSTCVHHGNDLQGSIAFASPDSPNGRLNRPESSIYCGRRTCDVTVKRQRECVVHGFVPEAVGGVELHCYNLASELARRHPVAVLAWRADPARPDYELDEQRQDQLTVWRLNHRFTDLHSFRETYQNTRVDDIFDELVDRWQPDIVHVLHLIGLSTGILERAKRRDLPLVLDLHDYWFGCPRGQRIRDPLVVCHDIDRRFCVPCLKPQNYELRAPRRPVLRWLSRLRSPSFRRGLRILAEYDADMQRALSLPDALITPSMFHKNMYGRYGVDPEKIHVVPVGIPVDASVPRRTSADGSIRIGYLGTLIPSKGAHVLLEAYRLLGRSGVTLDFYGVCVPFHEHTDVPRILADIDILVVPSVWYESYSIVIREGFRAGIAVVASNHGAMAEAIEHDVNGLLFAPDDPTDLASQLRRLVDDASLRDRLGAHPQRVENVATNTARHEELYASLLNAPVSR
jgi:glycosyltransferase involved in cell wall biosynthesis